MADVVLVASERQRLLVLGMLSAAGRLSPRVVAEDPGLDAMVRIVPFGLPEEPPDDGLSPLRSPVGPFDADAFVRQVRHLAGALTRHIYIFGTAGEGYAVSEGQFDQVAGTFWTVARECAVTPMLGVISLSLATIIERIERGGSRSCGCGVWSTMARKWNRCRADLSVAK